MHLTGWKYALFVSGVVGSIGLAMYPIYFYPKMHIDEYSEYLIPILWLKITNSFLLQNKARKLTELELTKKRFNLVIWGYGLIRLDVNKSFIRK